MDDATAIEPTSTTPLSQAELDALTDQLIEKLKTVFDPEIPVDIYELGLIYKVDVSDEKNVTIDMTLTSPACPLTDQIEWEAQAALGQLARSVTINWVWLPPWTMDMITEDGREQLRAIGFMI